MEYAPTLFHHPQQYSNLLVTIGAKTVNQHMVAAYTVFHANEHENCDEEKSFSKNFKIYETFI